MPGSLFGAATPPSSASGGGRGGWIGLDPTNAVIASDQHVVLAVGRDYTDVAPMDGVIVGSGGQQIDVAVNVTPAG